MRTRSQSEARTIRRGVVLSLGVLAGTLVVAPAAPAAPAGAQGPGPGAAAGPDAAPSAVSVTPTAFAAEPRNMAWAHQIARRVHQGDDQWLLVPNDEQEVRDLAAQLDASSNVSSTIRAYLLESSPVQARIGTLYQQLLERPADPSGLAFWGDRIRTGRLSFENLVVTLTISNEAWQKAGATPAGYTDWVFEHVLGRPADPSGRAFWIARLEQGTSRDRFVRSFLRSTERARTLVRASFRQHLARDADRAGLDHWVSRYAAARIGEVDLAVALLASNESRQAGCGYDPKHCLFPFPNDDFMRLKQGGPGSRVELKPEWLPKNASGKAIDPTEWNRNDGFSVGQAIVLHVPGIDLIETGAAGLEDIGSSLDEDAPIVITVAGTDEKVPYWAELDAQAGPGEQVLYIRPAVNYRPGTQYVVGLRNLKTSTGALIASPPAFDRHRDAIIAKEPWLDPVDYVGKEFAAMTLTELGWDIEQAYLFWTFTTGTTDHVTGRMLHIRDQALATLAPGGAPAFTVETVTPNPRAGVAKRVEGTFQVPLYLTGTGQPGATFTNRANGLPTRNGSYPARFRCEISASASAESPSRATVYGHGLFGSLNEVGSGPQAAMVGNHNMTYCATDWIGMASPDVANALAILQDLSSFGSLPDRSQQGILNFTFLGRLLRSDAGFVSHEAFQDEGEPLIDTSHLFYDGNSQGAVIGGAYVAVDPDVEAGVLGVAGMNYATLLERSVDFDPFFALMKTTYPDRIDQVVGLQLIQMLWDRGETNGYAAHLNQTSNLPGTVPKRVLIHTALGDHQVATLTAEITARTAGLPVHRPVYGPGRSSDVEPAWGIPGISYPSTGGGLIVWDSGAALSPIENVPPREGRDPHSDPRNSPESQQQKSQFLRSGGTLIDVCGGSFCTAPG